VRARALECCRNSSQSGETMRIFVHVAYDPETCADIPFSLVEMLRVHPLVSYI
jgi:hypothetical protein